ncbi:formate dehydrogenase accessory sulfurtransferase FdhD [Undibacterium sp. Ji42W]|uniref:formate dehydrogenase accessory sulfurtransferase FdhD n=1 Tax=Undibacterium sp. Ji42W TaxID=3413039 RepID=UPI003BEF5638
MESLNYSQDQLSHALMAELAQHTEALSLPRLCKRLGVRQSTLLRCIAYLGEEVIGQQRGAGWVHLRQDGERSLLSLTEEGRRVCESTANRSDGEFEVQTGIVRRNVQRCTFASYGAEELMDQIAQEVPVALVYNGISHAVMLATPMDLEDFALGFSLSEAIVDDAGEIYDIECQSSPEVQGIEVQVQISAVRFAALKERRRHLAGNTGCGLCGKDSLQALQMHLPLIRTELVSRLPQGSLLKALEGLSSLQSINLQTGAVHAAAWVNMQGEILVLREDVGRHNALDKLIGALAIVKVKTKLQVEGFILMSSRLSYELVQKAARANIAIVAALSAPTALAIDLAEQAGICLIGFVRQHGYVVYTHPERLLAE